MKSERKDICTQNQKKTGEFSGEHTQEGRLDI